MAKGISVSFSGANSSFAFEKLERSKLYGTRRRVALGADGLACIRASLTEDGQVLLRSGMTAQGYFAEDGRQVDAAELVSVDDAGNPLALVPSTLGVEQPLVGPIDPKELLDVGITSIYRLTPETIDDALAKALASGEIFRAPFNYRPDYRCETAYLVQNDNGLFALVGVPTTPAWLAPDAPPPVDESADADDDLDFEMF
jgi:hypothetical protein